MSNAKLAAALYYDQLRQDQAHEDAIHDQLPPGWGDGHPGGGPPASSTFPEFARLIQTVIQLDARIHTLETALETSHTDTDRNIDAAINAAIPPITAKIESLEQRIDAVDATLRRLLQQHEPLAKWLQQQEGAAPAK